MDFLGKKKNRVRVVKTIPPKAVINGQKNTAKCGTKEPRNRLPPLSPAPITYWWYGENPSPFMILIGQENYPLKNSIPSSFSLTPPLK